MQCADFLEFQDYLKKSRDIDDKLIYVLNSSLPTTSFQSNLDLSIRCKDLYTKLEENFKHREDSIHKCINESKTTIQQLRSQSSDSFDVTKNLKNEQTKMRLLRTELGVEEIVKDRSLKLFYERCRSFYKPENLSM